MSSYRKRSQGKPMTAAGLRAQASANGNSIFGNRPRSMPGLFSLNQNSYSALLGLNGSGGSSYGTGTKFHDKQSDSGRILPSFRKSNNYSRSMNSLNYQNPYTTYGGTASGYGGLTLPSQHSSSSALNLATPSTTYNYLNSMNAVPRAGSFNKTKPKSSSSLAIASRSSSLQSLANSEGYGSGNERSGRSSRLGSVSSISSETTTTTAAPVRAAAATRSSSTSENGELDYKKLYEESQAENDRLRTKLRRSDEQLKETKGLLEKAQNAQKSVMSEAEKRERRAMERKLSEMEEELKIMDQLKCENQRLKDENGALIRVISKLSK